MQCFGPDRVHWFSLLTDDLLQALFSWEVKKGSYLSLTRFLSLVTQWETLPCGSGDLRCHVHLWGHSGQQHQKWRNVPVPGNAPTDKPALTLPEPPRLCLRMGQSFWFCSPGARWLLFRTLPTGSICISDSAAKINVSLKSCEMCYLDRHFGRAKLSGAFSVLTEIRIALSSY